MVSLVVETGLGLPNANSYVSLQYADEYFTAHPFYADAWAAITDPDRRTALLAAGTLQLDVQFSWRGERATTTQALDWPRWGVYDSYDTLLSRNTVPERVRQATCEMAYWLTKGDVTTAGQASSGINRLKIDVIELEFSGSTSLPAVPPAVRGLVRGLGELAGGYRVRKVLVG